MKMRTFHQASHKTAGNALMITLFFCSVLGIMMVGYLLFARQENLLSARSQVWNSAISVVEAGVEDAMEHLNSNETNLTADGWGYYGSPGYYFRSRVLPSGDRYYVTISLATPTEPEIISRAWIQAPAYALSGSQSMFAASGVTLSGPMVNRAVRVKARKSHLFINALTAKRQIELNGNNIMTDSFDSSNPAYSTGGQYDPAKRRDNGGVASNDTIENTVSVGNANIYGKVATGPDGSVYVGPNGRIGPLGWNPTGNDKIYPDWFTDDMNFTFMDPELPGGSVSVPSGGYVTNVQIGVSSTTTTSYPSPEPLGGVTTNVTSYTSSTYPSPVPSTGVVTNTIVQFKTSTTYPAEWTYVGTVTTRQGKGQDKNTTYYDYYAITGYTYTYDLSTYTYSIPTTNIVDVVYYDYILEALPGGQIYRLPSLDENKKVLVRGAATLDVTGAIDLTKASITIQPTGDLDLYIHSNLALAGNNVVNQPGYADRFIIWADAGCTSISYSGNASFTGVIYAPYANFVFNGSGNNTVDFNGAAVVNSAYLNGHYNFHYDEDLAKMASGRYLVYSWDEI